MNTKFFAFAPMLLAAGMTVGTSASALTLNTTGLKANATLTFSVPAWYSATGRTVEIAFKPVANMTLNGMVDVVDEETGEPAPVPQYNLPVTKADVKIGWDLSIKATSGDSTRSGLLLTRRGNTIGLANFKVDFVNKFVKADLLHTDGTATLNAPLYSFVELVPQKISFKGFVLNQSVTIGKLILTEAAQKEIGDVLQLSAPLRATLVTQDWGTIAILVTSYTRPKVSNEPLVAADLPAALAQ